MKNTVDLTNITMPVAISYKTEGVLSTLQSGCVSFLVNTDLDASYVEMIASQLGWNVEMQPQEENFMIKACKEVIQQNCA